MSGGSRTPRRAIDRDEVQQFQDQWITARYVNGSVDVPKEEGDRLTGRLTVLLSPAPNDNELWQELATVHERLADRHRGRRSRATSDRSPPLDRAEQQAYQTIRDRLAGWLTRPGGDLDPVTGLPWSQINQYRIIDDPDIGPVPQYIEMARKLAEDNAGPEDRQRAEMVREAPDWQRFAVPMAELHADRLTWLPSLLLDAADYDDELRPLLADLLRVWADPRVQRLLLAETSRGWTAETNAGSEPESPGA